MEVKLVPHVSVEKTPYGTVSRSQNQEIVLLKNEDTDAFVQCGYVGDTHFLPLSGFPQELCGAVAEECSKQLGRPVAAGVAPPGLSELVAIVNANAGVSEDDDE
jgi:hypothetical protein